MFWPPAASSRFSGLNPLKTINFRWLRFKTSMAIGSIIWWIPTLCSLCSSICVKLSNVISSNFIASENLRGSFV